MSQAEAIAAVERLGSVGKMVGSEWKGSCPPRAATTATDRLYLRANGVIKCRKCADDGKAVWQAAREPDQIGGVTVMQGLTI